MVRIKLNKAHPAGSMYMRGPEGVLLQVTNAAWSEVAEITPDIELKKRWLIIEAVSADSPPPIKKRGK